MGKVFDYNFLLSDRIQKIKSINDIYDLEKNAYISFSGGKDSTVLHYLIDIALPNNTIPRVYMNTGIEYNDIVEYVKDMAKNDKRFNIVKPSTDIKESLRIYGYPFKSKEHARLLHVYQNSGECHCVKEYIGKGEKKSFLCPKCLRYQFSEDFKINVSDKCCDKLKKEPLADWARQWNRHISITGIRREEGGHRKGIVNCIAFKNGKMNHFHPLLVLNEEWLDLFIEKNNIKLCKLYYPPFNFKRTGCKGCPFNIDIEKQLNFMKEFMPAEYKQCIDIWKPIYNEYKRIKYRFKDRTLFV